MRSRNNGFTLIELIIVIAIIAIIAAIAIPKYQAHIRNTDEKAMLIVLQEQMAAMQRWRAKTNSYAAAMSEDGTTPLCNDTPTGVIFTYPPNGIKLYEMACKQYTDTARNQFIIEVNAFDQQRKQLCTKLVVNQDGIVVSTSSESPKSNNAACDNLFKK